MSLASLVVSSVSSAKRSMGDLVLHAVVTRITNVSYDASQSKPVQTTLTKGVDGFVGLWEIGEVDGTVVRKDDVKFYVFPPGFDFKDGDRILVNGIDYDVLKFTPTYAGSQVALTMLQLRK